MWKSLHVSILLPLPEPFWWTMSKASILHIPFVKPSILYRNPTRNEPFFPNFRANPFGELPLIREQRTQTNRPTDRQTHNESELNELNEMN